MQVLRHVAGAGALPPAPVVALGEFDGVHIGHQRVLRRAVELAQQCANPPIAITFYRPRSTAVDTSDAALLIESLRQRVGRIAALGFDTIVVQRLPRRSSLSLVETALRELPIYGRNVKTVVCGSCTDVGDGSEGGRERLVAAGRRYGFDLDIIDAVFVCGTEVGTAAVRRAILAGDLIAARSMLGRPPEVSGRVRRGFQRGRSIGFPTANLHVSGIALPPNGVYAVRVRVGRHLHGGVANLGVNPTFGGDQRALEPHIFDFNGDLYGERLDVQFIEALRVERKFANGDELARQIRLDVEAAHIALERA